MAPYPLILLPKVCHHLLNLAGWVQIGLTKPLPAVTTAAESYIVEGGEHAPSLLRIGNAVSPMPMFVGHSPGDVLGELGVAIQTDDASHEDFSIIPELNLLSRIVRSSQVVRLKAAGDGMDGDFKGHDVVEIGEVEVASFCDTTRIGAIAFIRTPRLLAEPVSGVERRHFGGHLCSFVEKRIGDS